MNRSDLQNEKNEILWPNHVGEIEMVLTIILVIEHIKERNPEYKIRISNRLKDVIKEKKFIQSLVSRIKEESIDAELKQYLVSLMVIPKSSTKTEIIRLTSQEKAHIKQLLSSSFSDTKIEAFEGVDIEFYFKPFMGILDNEDVKDRITIKKLKQNLKKTINVYHLADKYGLRYFSCKGCQTATPVLDGECVLCGQNTPYYKLIDPRGCLVEIKFPNDEEEEIWIYNDDIKKAGSCENMAFKFYNDMHKVIAEKIRAMILEVR